jgi:hypothetical protein
MNGIVDEIALVIGPIRPLEHAMTFLFALDIISLILGAIRPLLDAITILFVIFPVAFVFGSIRVDVNSKSRGLINLI